LGYAGRDLTFPKIKKISFLSPGHDNPGHGSGIFGLGRCPPSQRVSGVSKIEIQVKVILISSTTLNRIIFTDLLSYEVYVYSRKVSLKPGRRYV
jgi:hypothetical protein